MSNYQKNFDDWNEKKKSLDCKLGDIFYNVREIWWASIGLNIGSEQNGTGKDFDRPILILKGMSKNCCLIIPLTSSIKNNKMRFPLGKVRGKNASAILSQIRAIDTKRLTNKICYLEKEKFKEIKKVVKELI